MAVDLSKYVEKARAALRTKNYDYAMDLYKQALRLSPNDTEVRAELRKVQNAAAQQTGRKSGGVGRFFNKLKSRTQALLPPRSKEAAEKQMADCEDMLCKNPGNVDTLMALGRASTVAGHFDTSIQTFESVTKLSKDAKLHKQAEKARANAYEKRGRDGDLKKAFDIWSRLAKEDVTDREAVQRSRDMAARMQSTKLEGAMDVEKGKAAREQMTDEQRKDAKKLQLIASDEYRSEEDYILGIEIVNDKLKERPDDPNLYAEKGDHYLHLNRYREALEQYKKAQELSPHDYRFVMREHDLKIRAEENELSKLKKLAASGDQKARQEYTRRYKKLVAFKLQSYEKREKAYPTDINIKFNLAETYLQYKKYPEALQRYQLAVNDPKYRLKALLSIGKCFMAQNQFDLAIRRFTDGISSIEVMNPRKMEFLYTRGECYEKMDKQEEARKDFLAIFEYDVSFKDVAERVKKIKG